MADESAERRARMLGLQADAELPDEQRIAESVESDLEVDRRKLEIQMVARRRGVYLEPSRYTFVVEPAVARARLGSWSDPVRFQFREASDGRLELWMQTVKSEGEG